MRKTIPMSCHFAVTHDTPCPITQKTLQIETAFIIHPFVFEELKLVLTKLQKPSLKHISSFHANCLVVCSVHYSLLA